MKDSVEQRRKAWSTYWRSGAPHSLPGSFNGLTYGGSVEKRWASAMSGLSQGSRVLEIGCGNGALALWMLAQLRAGLDVRFACVDLAELDPDRLFKQFPAAAQSVDLFPNTSSEALPFEDRSFALIVGQFSVEYTAVDRTLAEAARVSAPGGRLALIVHHRDSAIIRMATEELKQLRWVRDDSGLFEATRALVPYMALADTPMGVKRLDSDTTYQELKQAFNRAQEQLEKRAEGSLAKQLLATMAGGSAEVLKQARAGTREQALAGLDRLAADLETSELRLAELCDVAFNGEQASALVEKAKALGYEYQTLEPVDADNGQTLAWWILLQRGAA